MLKDENGFPRRSRLDLCEAAEKAIYDAMQEVEKLGADERLTNAVVKLSEAKDLVSDYIDEKKAKEPEANETTSFEPGGDDEEDTGGSNPPPNKERP
jgi:hypothetical protein